MSPLDLAKDVIVSEDGMTEGSSEKGLHWKFDVKAGLYLSGTDVPGNQGSALSEIKDLVSVAKPLWLTRILFLPLGTDDHLDKLLSEIY